MTGGTVIVTLPVKMRTKKRVMYAGVETTFMAPESMMFPSILPTLDVAACTSLININKNYNNNIKSKRFISIKISSCLQHHLAMVKLRQRVALPLMNLNIALAEINDKYKE